MSINLDVVIDTPDSSVDMKSGLDTLQGVSDASRTIATTILSGVVPERNTPKAKVRTTLRQSFIGSYGQRFSIDIYDEQLDKKFKKIGKAAFAELIGYFLNDAVYLEYDHLSLKAQGVLKELGDTAEELSEQLRTSSVENIHEVTNKFDHEIKVRYRKSRDEQIVLAKFDIETGSVLDVIKSNEQVEIVACITRLNINTGNGRLQVQGENETVAFGFSMEYQAIPLIGKKKFSENLDENNGVPSEHRKYLKLSATPMHLANGKIIKYLIEGFGD